MGDQNQLKSKKESSYIREGLYAFIFCMLFSFIFFVWILREGRNMRFNELDQEAYKMAEEKSLSGVEGEKMKEEEEALARDPSKPLWVSQPFLISKGEKVYQVNCSVCHGVSGKGDGPASKGLKPPPQDLVGGKWEYGGDSVGLFQSISNGVQGTSMAAFKHLPKEDRWALVHFIRSITQNKIEDHIERLEDFGKKAQ